MQTYTINSAKELEKYKESNGYHIKGNAEFTYSADFEGRLLVDGYLSIEVGEYIKAGESIKAGRYIKAGESYGISARPSITTAGICTWRKITDNEKTITCSKLRGGGVVEYGILKATGEPELDDKIKEAMKLLSKNGYRIIKDTQTGRTEI